MRKNKIVRETNDISILALDDDEIMTATLQSYFQSVGFDVKTENDPIKAVERIKTEHFDILLLDFLMSPINGDEVVKRIREFDHDIFIILLTGHKSMAPPIKTIRELDIQGYYEKSNRFDELELLVESCVKSIKHMRTINSYQNSLQKILNWMNDLNGYKNINDLTDTILKQCAELLDCEDVCIYLNKESVRNYHLLVEKGVKTFNGIGKYSETEPNTNHEVSEIIRGSNENKIVYLYNDMLFAVLKSAEDKVFGVLAVGPVDTNKANIQLFEVYAEQAVAVVKNLILHEIINIRSVELEKMYDTMHDNYMRTIDTMRQIVDAKDYYTRGHSDRVSAYAVALAKALGKSDDFVQRVRIAGLFHDVGKLGIPDNILQKPGPLTDEEYDIIKTHPAKGKQIISSLSSFDDILNIVEDHHERIDGKGYPNGLKGDRIPDEAKIINIADTFDAMTSKRTYRNSLTTEQALEELKRCRGTQFDPHMVDTFVDLINSNSNLRKKLDWTFKSLDDLDSKEKGENKK